MLHGYNKRFMNWKHSHFLETTPNLQCKHLFCELTYVQISLKILSRASEAGSPTNPPWALGSDKTRGQGFKKKRTAYLIRPFLVRQGEPGTSQYICYLHVNKLEQCDITSQFSLWGHHRIPQVNICIIK